MSCSFKCNTEGIRVAHVFEYEGGRNTKYVPFFFIKKNTNQFEIIIHVNVVESVRKHNTPPGPESWCRKILLQSGAKTASIFALKLTYCKNKKQYSGVF
jgi:hypothetical protein